MELHLRCPKPTRLQGNIGTLICNSYGKNLFYKIISHIVRFCWYGILSLLIRMCICLCWHQGTQLAGKGWYNTKSQRI